MYYSSSPNALAGLRRRSPRRRLRTRASSSRYLSEGPVARRGRLCRVCCVRWIGSSGTQQPQVRGRAAPEQLFVRTLLLSRRVTRAKRTHTKKKKINAPAPQLFPLASPRSCPRNARYPVERVKPFRLRVKKEHKKKKMESHPPARRTRS
jgi:hypothetical protein